MTRSTGSYLLTDYLMEEQQMAGQVQGLASYPPLHTVCARRDPGAINVRPLRRCSYDYSVLISCR